MADGAQIVHI